MVSVMGNLSLFTFFGYRSLFHNKGHSKVYKISDSITPQFLNELSKLNKVNFWERDLIG